MRTPLRKAAVALVTSGALVVGLAACGGDDAGDGDSGNKVVVYSGRSEALVKPVLEKFTKETGIKVQARYGNTAQMAAQLLEEGDKSPAEVFFAQDAGALGAVTKKGLFAKLPEATLSKVPASYRAEGGEWVGVTARSRVLAYNPEQVPADQLPKSVFELTQPQWKGKVAIAPTNGSFQAFVTAITVMHGEAKTKEFLAGLKANDVQIRENNVRILEDVNDGKLATGLINHYYLGEIAKEKGTTPDGLKARLHFFPDGDTGALVNVAGVGVMKKAAEDADVKTLVDYLLGTEAQTHFSKETFEYPVVDGVAPPAGVPALKQLTAPSVNLNDLDALDATIKIIKESGLVP